MPDTLHRPFPIEEVRARTEEVLAAHADLEGPLLPILHAIQKSFGFIPQDAVPQIADALPAHPPMTFWR